MIEGQEHQTNSDMTDHYMCDDVIHYAMPVLLDLNNNDDRDIYVSQTFLLSYSARNIIAQEIVIY